MPEATDYRREDIMTMQEAADYLRISYTGMRRLMQANVIRSFRVGLGQRRVVFARSDIRQYVLRNSSSSDAIKTQQNAMAA